MNDLSWPSQILELLFQSTWKIEERDIYFSFLRFARGKAGNRFEVSFEIDPRKQFAVLPVILETNTMALQEECSIVFNPEDYSFRLTIGTSFTFRVEARELNSHLLHVTNLNTFQKMTLKKTGANFIYHVFQREGEKETQSNTISENTNPIVSLKPDKVACALALNGVSPFVVIAKEYPTVFFSSEKMLARYGSLFISMGYGTAIIHAKE